MKDFTKKELEEGRPNLSTEEAVVFAFDRLFEERTKNTSDEVVRGLTFEELIGALLLARDTARGLPTKRRRRAASSR